MTKLLAPFRRLVVSVALLTALTALLEGAFASLVVPFLRALEKGSGAASMSLLLAALLAARGAAGYASDMSAASLQNKFLRHIREAIVSKLYTLSEAALDPGALVNLYLEQAASVMGSFAAVVALVGSGLLAAVYLVPLWAASPYLLLFALIAGTAALYPAALASRVVGKYGARLVAAEETLSRLVIDDIHGLSELKVFGACPARFEAHRKEGESFFSAAMGIQRWRNWVKPASDTALGILLLVGVASLLFARPAWARAHAAELAGAVFLLQRFQSRLAALAQSLSAISEHRQEARNAVAFLGRAAEEILGVSEGAFDSLTLKNIGLSYRASTPVLKNIDLTLKCGEIFAIVGKSGAGKSTLLKILSGVLKPTEGTIAVNGSPKRAAVFDGGRVFDETVRWNITLGRPVEESLIHKAAEEAGLTQTIAALPEKYETRVGASGVLLSAGERQRLALARAILDEPTLLLLDEATGALDPLTEAAIVGVLKRRAEQCLTVLVTHRFGLLSAVDKILVLEKGSPAGLGSHLGLLETSPAYGALVSGLEALGAGTASTTASDILPPQQSSSHSLACST